MDPHRSCQVFNAEAEAYIERLSSYALAFEKSSAQLRQKRTPEQIKVAYDRARTEWEDKANGFPGPVVPSTASPLWNEMWNKLETVLTSTPKTDKDLALRCIAGAFAMSALTDHELAQNPLQIAIMNEAERRTMSLMPPEDGVPANTSTVEQPKYVDLIGCDIPWLDFTITDYGTSHSNGPWVQYLQRGRTEGKDEKIVPADEMEMMLERSQRSFMSARRNNI